MAEFRQQLERAANRGNSFRNLLDAFFKHVAASGSQSEIADSRGINSHHPAAGRVYRHWIAAHHDHTAWLGLPLDGPISFHAHDAIHDGEAAGKNPIQLSHGPVNAQPVQLVLWPTVQRTGHNAE